MPGLARVRFSTRLPGLVAYPPNVQPWEATLRPADLRTIAAATEAAGFYAVAVPEQIVLSSADAAVMGDRWPDALSTMAYLAGTTERLHWIATVLILPLHEPIGLAKAVATLDWMTEGRIEFGFGVSIFPDEYAAIGVPYNERGRIADEYLEAMHELWSSDEPNYEGRYVRFSDVVFEPRPRPGGPTIWIGGDSAAALRRAARFAHGWMPFQVTQEQLPARRAELLAEVAAHRPGFEPQIAMPLALLQVGADHRPISGSGRAEAPAGIDETLQRIDDLKAAGATMISVTNPVVESLGAHLAWLESFGSDVLSTQGETHGP